MTITHFFYLKVIQVVTFKNKLPKYKYRFLKDYLRCSVCTSIHVVL